MTTLRPRSVHRCSGRRARPPCSRSVPALRWGIDARRRCCGLRCNRDCGILPSGHGSKALPLPRSRHARGSRHAVVWKALVATETEARCMHLPAPAARSQLGDGPSPLPGLMARLLTLDFARFDDALPAGDVALDEGAHLLRAGGARLAAELDEALRGLRLRQELAHLGVQALDDRRRRAAGSA